MAQRDTLERRWAELYTGGFGDFTKRRVVLARALRDAGDAAGAARITGAKKPSISAWAVTQLIAQGDRAIATLIEAGDAARSALSAVLGGGDPAALRARMDTLQRAISTATARAGEIVERETGRAPSEAVRARMGASLRALALAPEGRERVAAGYLEEDLAAPGIDVLGAVPMPTARTSARPVDGARRAEAEKAKRESAEQARLERRRTEAERAAEAAEARRRAEAERARRAREREARARAEALAREADRAEALAREARRRADEAARALERLRAP